MKNLKSHIIILLLSIFLLQVNAQELDIIYFKSVKIFPVNYNNNDSIKIILDITTPNTSHKIGDYNWKIDSNQINLYLCLFMTGQFMPVQYNDTINIGKLPVNNYNLTVFGYSSLISNECIPKDTVQYSMQFSVINNINILENNIKYSIFPNPANKLLNVELGKKLKGKIKITDIRGQIKYINNFNNENNIQVNTESFSIGIYILSIQSSEFSTTSKFIVYR